MLEQKLGLKKDKKNIVFLMINLKTAGLCDAFINNKSDD